MGVFGHRLAGDRLPIPSGFGGFTPIVFAGLFKHTNSGVGLSSTEPKAPYRRCGWELPETSPQQLVSFTCR